ncbi:MAG: hypothetical protein K8R88_13905 [Armatimonadetes bacterium]|nr:hypothetical protein [Armatimonadota bacterium]
MIRDLILWGWNAERIIIVNELDDGKIMEGNNQGNKNSALWPWLAVGGVLAAVAVAFAYKQKKSVPAVIGSLVDFAEDVVLKLESQLGEDFKLAI